jgi:peptide/nickel transport system substrate-binding protein
VATVRSEPRSFNRLVARDRASHLVSLLLHARLVKLNLATQDIEPSLAERWELAQDNRTYTFHLRRGVTFSDGAPFTARDVAFSVRALGDPKVGSPLATVLQVGGVAPVASVVDDYTVTIAFGGPFAPALRTLDAVPILPAHRLEAALDAGTFRDAWSVTTPPGEMAGLGAFVLRGYEPGVRIEFERNARYWRRDADGSALPKLDRLTLDVVPNQNAEMLRLDSGEADLISSEARAEDIAALREAAAGGRLRVEEAGIGLDPDMFWFNLRPDAGIAADRQWLTRPEFREAVSLAIDRQAFVDVVYLGAGAVVDGPITPGHKRWYDAARPVTAYDPGRAAHLLEALGLADRDGDGQRETGAGTPARFVLVTQKGNAVRERAAAFLQQELAKVGLVMEVVSLEAGALVDLITKGSYEAAWFGVQSNDTDPGTHLDFWLSSGSFHVWHPEQASPATPWERRIDDLMQQMVATFDEAQRTRLFAEVQREFAAARPVLYMAAPRVVIPMSTHVGRARPALLQPAVLWDAEHLTSTRR